MKPILLFLTCASLKEAEIISSNLLDKHLVVCIKKFPVSSAYLWKGKKEKAEEILLIMESEEKLFAKIETIVKKLHSYETPVLINTPIIKTSSGVINWFNQELK